MNGRRWWMALVLAVVIAVPAYAGLPVAVDGEPVPSLAPMLKRATPAVVNIATRGRVRAQTNPLLADPFFRRFFDLPPLKRQRRTQAVGSGVIVDAEAGYVITNNHVIANADEVVVTLRDRRRFRARLVGTDPATDIAVLQIPAESLTALPLADSDALEVGDFVVAIGNPFGLGQTVTSGIVSALGRSGLGIEGFEDFIQTDASINPGNSGGALVDLRGRLAGINTAIIGPAGGNVGIGFAIPINMVVQVMDQLVAFGEVRRGVLGVKAQDVTPDIADALGLETAGGAVITAIARSSPAEAAGLRTGDVVVAVDGIPVRSAADLRNKVGLRRVGREVELTVIRDRERLTLKAEIAAPQELAFDGDGRLRRLVGATFGDLAEGRGVAVLDVQPGSPAWRLGLREGDVVLAVNRQPVRSLAEFRAAARAARQTMVLRIKRGNARVMIVVR